MFQNFTNAQVGLLLLVAFCFGYLLRLYLSSKNKNGSKQLLTEKEELQQQLTSATTELKTKQEQIDKLTEDKKEHKDHIEHIMKEKEALVMQITSLGNAMN